MSASLMTLFEGKSVVTREPTYADFYEKPEEEQPSLSELERANLIRQCANIALDYGRDEISSGGSLSVSNRSLMTYHSIMRLLEPDREMKTSVYEAVLTSKARISP
jgi:hypothetical protein